MIETKIEELLSYQSKYCYKGTDVLINKLNIRDEKELEVIERTLVTYNLSRLYLRPVKGDYDIKHYLRIHKFLFGDLYDFAGEIRSENMSKGNTPFCRPEYIYEYLKYLLDEMNEKSNDIKNEEELLAFLAYYFSEINNVHPFRDGNGRTQREYFRQYMYGINKKIDFGCYELDYSLWQPIDHKNLILGCILSAHTGDTRILINTLKNAITKVEKKEFVNKQI